MTYKSENKHNNLFHDSLLVCAKDSIVHHYQMLGVLLLLRCSDSLRVYKARLAISVAPWVHRTAAK